LAPPSHFPHWESPQNRGSWAEVIVKRNKPEPGSVPFPRPPPFLLLPASAPVPNPPSLPSISFLPRSCPIETRWWNAVSSLGEVRAKPHPILVYSERENHSTAILYAENFTLKSTTKFALFCLLTLKIKPFIMPPKSPWGI